jgi:hypothetical protein
MSKTIFLHPLNAGGSVEHYFHFLFGYLIPFLHNVPPHDGNRYLFRDCGPSLNPILLSLPGYETALRGDESPDYTVGFAGFDTSEFSGLDLRSTREFLMGLFRAKVHPTKEVLVIDRGEPHPFYESLAEIPTSGRSKRSVPNMGEVFNSIREAMPARLVFLEGMPIKDQIELFASHKAFVMQHGAAMANLLFAPRGSAVLEIRDEGTEDFYVKMTAALSLLHSTARQDHAHAAVDPQEIVRGLRRLTRTSIAIL